MDHCMPAESEPLAGGEVRGCCYSRAKTRSAASSVAWMTASS